MNEKSTLNWKQEVPRWVVSAAFAVAVGMLLLLLVTGKEFRYKDAIGFRDPPRTKDIASSSFAPLEGIETEKVYKAQTDGFVLGTLIGTKTSGGVAGIRIVAEESLNPSNLRAADTITAHRQGNWENNQRASALAPIRVGEAYKVSVTGNMNSNQYETAIFWIAIK